MLEHRIFLNIIITQQYYNIRSAPATISIGVRLVPAGAVILPVFVAHYLPSPTSYRIRNRNRSRPRHRVAINVFRTLKLGTSQRIWRLIFRVVLILRVAGFLFLSENAIFVEGILAFFVEPWSVAGILVENPAKFKIQF